MDTPSTLSSVERQNQILRWLTSQPRITTADICYNFSVSKATARRDLESLAS
jgi:DeoR/GlpR family transcriptional regulator of sugar metabolism